MEKFPHEQGGRELRNLKQVEISLSGWEVYSLIAAVQLLKTTSRADSIGKTMNIAQVAARKLHRKLVPCHNVYTLLDQGWELGATEPDLTTQANDTNS